MNVFHLKQTEETPLVHFDPCTGKMEIRGNSIPENIYLFFDPLFEWLDKYLKKPHSETEFIFEMKMISSSSSKMFFELINKIDAFAELTDKQIKITWLYNIYDDEIREMGADFKEYINVPFEIVLVDEN